MIAEDTILAVKVHELSDEDSLFETATHTAAAGFTLIAATGVASNGSTPTAATGAPPLVLTPSLIASQSPLPSDGETAMWSVLGKKTSSPAPHLKELINDSLQEMKKVSVDSLSSLMDKVNYVCSKSTLDANFDQAEELDKMKRTVEDIKNAGLKLTSLEKLFREIQIEYLTKRSEKVLAKETYFG